MKRLRTILMLSFGHGITDIYPGLLSPLLPIFIARYGWSITTTGMLVTVLQLSSNLSQMGFAIVHDHRPTRTMLWGGILLAGLPFIAILMTSNVLLLSVLLVVCGLGVGMYHPPAAVAAGQAAHGYRSGVMMGIFSSGGLIGFLAAPLFAVLFIEVLGDAYMPLVVLPSLIGAALLFSAQELTFPSGHGYSVRQWFGSLLGNTRELFILWLVSSFRSMVHMLLGAFLPMLLLARGYTYTESALFLSMQLFSGMLGMLIGGHLSDVHGSRRIMAGTLFVTTPLLLGFLATTGPVSLLFLFCAMGALSSTIPVNILMAQRAAPKLASVASSLVMGLSFAMGAIAATPFGMLADRIGIEPAMHIPAVFPLIGAACVSLIKND